jgi:hypothetical protein
MKIEIKKDLFNIVKRLKNIDKDYFVLYNTKKSTFELHAHGQAPTSYCLTFKHLVLDERALTHALKTRRQNQEKLFEEMEIENQRFLKSEQENLLRSYYGC